MMRKALLGLGLLAMVAVAVPRRADAHVSVAIGLPGFGFFLGAPPVVYAPPVAYAAPVYAPPAYYAPCYRCGPPVAYAPAYFHDNGRHRGWYKHGW
jgi:hypothetical protein